MESVGAQIAEWRAYVAQRPGGRRPRRRGAGGPSSPSDRRAERGRSHGRRGLPDRREADGGRRRPVPGVRTRAQRPTVEAARPRAVTTSGRARPAAGSRRSLFAVAAAVTIQVARLAAGFPDEEPTWLARNASLLVLPFLAAYFARRRQLDVAALAADGGAVRARRARRQPLPVGRAPRLRRLGHRGSRHPQPARRPLVRGRLPVHGRHAASRTSGAWTSSASRASGSSTTC